MKPIAITALFVLAGCAAPWKNPNIADEKARARQLLIDDGYCTRVAAGSAPMPDVRVYQPAQSYQHQGTVTTYTPTGGAYTSTYTGSSVPVGGGFAAGFNQGASTGAMIGAAFAQRKVHRACMYSLGWEEE